MKLVNQQDLIKLQLGRDLRRAIKRGHAWVYSQALKSTPQAAPGTPALLFDSRGRREVGRGFYDPDSPIALRVCSTQPSQALDDEWAARQMGKALALRRVLFDNHTTGYRLFNGEGDGLPGLVCDVYSDLAVLQVDGAGAASFWQARGIAAWLVEHARVAGVYLKTDERSGIQPTALAGEIPAAPAPFMEHGLRFTADPVRGQKTGFFLDQRENRALVGSLAKAKTVLNMFGYTGGFSVYAAAGGAKHVTTVDLAAPALAQAQMHWESNQLPVTAHSTHAADAFEFLQKAAKAKQFWDMVVLDPPSFAPSEAAVPAAVKAYTRLIAAGAKATASGGLLAASSCSSHIDQARFMVICEEAISRARRRATTLGIYGQPPDHPAPLVMPELRYLKFVLMQLD